MGKRARCVFMNPLHTLVGFECPGTEAMAVSIMHRFSVGLQHRLRRKLPNAPIATAGSGDSYSQNPLNPATQRQWQMVIVLRAAIRQSHEEALKDAWA